jgi:arginase
MQILGASFGKGQGKEGVELAFEHLIEKGLFDLLPVSFYENLHFNKDSEYIEDYLRVLSEKTFELRNQDDFLLTIGGDHTIALGSVAGILKARPNTSLIWVDSHADYNDVNSSITGNLHGMPLNGLVNGKKTFNSLLFEWLGEGFINPKNVAIIGLNDVDPKEKEMLSRSGIALYWDEDIFLDGIQHVVKSAIKRVGGEHIHLSFDMDSIRNDHFSATGCFCPNGMDLNSAKYLFHALKSTNKLKSMDLVEYNPTLDFTKEQHKIVLDLLRELL